MRSRVSRSPAPRAPVALPLILAAGGLIALAGCGEGSGLNVDRSDQTSPAIQSGAQSGAHSGASAMAAPIGLEPPRASASLTLQRSPVAAGTYRIEPGNPSPVPVPGPAPGPLAAAAFATSTSVPDAAGRPSARAGTPLEGGGTNATNRDQQGTEIVVQPGLPESASIRHAGAAPRLIR